MLAASWLIKTKLPTVFNSEDAWKPYFCYSASSYSLLLGFLSFFLFSFIRFAMLSTRIFGRKVAKISSVISKGTNET